MNATASTTLCRETACPMRRGVLSRHLSRRSVAKAWKGKGKRKTTPKAIHPRLMGHLWDIWDKRPRSGLAGTYSAAICSLFDRYLTGLLAMPTLGASQTEEPQDIGPGGR